MITYYQVNLGIFISNAQEHCNMLEYCLYQYRLGSMCIRSNYIKILNLNFQTRIAKIQNNKVGSIAHLEYATCISLRLGAEEVIDAGTDDTVRENSRGTNKVSMQFALYYYCHTLSNHFSTCTGNLIYCYENYNF